MIYLIPFFLVVAMLVVIIAYGKTIDMKIVLLMLIVAIGNGGYFALAMSKNLEEAVLANKIAYVIGSFAPITIWLIVCSICRIHVPRVLCMVLYTIQFFIYMSACTVGYQKWFYETVEFHLGRTGGYLTKTYGPMHVIYLISLFIYTLAGIVVAIYSLNRSNIVSRINVDILIFADLIAVGVYFLERVITLDIELNPMSFVISSVAMAVPMIKISIYSVYENKNFFNEEIEQAAYIVFSKSLKYMGCNECAEKMFPELIEWELERKIPGNGGRFNTFLRQPLQEYVDKGEIERFVGHTYEYKGELYHYEIGALARDKKKTRGFFIKVSNVTDVVKMDSV